MSGSPPVAQRRTTPRRTTPRRIGRHCTAAPVASRFRRILPADHLAQRLIRLYAGRAGFGISLALMVRARLGVGPWDVLNQGIARQLGVQIGWVVIAMSAVVLLAWIPLRQRPGLGTISNLVLVGLVTNATLGLLPAPSGLGVRTALLTAGIGLNAVATALYIGAGLGPGPRDGIMTGLAARGHSIRVARTCIEVSVIAAGYPLGGTVGPGTVAYALLIGLLVHLLLPRLALRQARGQHRDADRFTGPPAKIADSVRHFAELGFTAFNFIPAGEDRAAQVRRLAEEVLCLAGRP